MSRFTKEKSTENKNSSGTLVVVLMAVVYIILGLVMLFVPQIELVTLCYILSTILVIVGITFIVNYFLTESFKNMSQYGFSVGALFVILGMCALVKAGSLAQSFILCLGILLLISAIIKLQNSLDLKALKDSTWAFLLIISVVIALCAIVIIINPFPNTKDLEYFTYVILIADGVLSLISNLYLSIRVKKYKKKEALIIEQQETDKVSSEMNTSEQEQPETCPDTESEQDGDSSEE